MIGGSRRHEYQLRADLPDGFPQVDRTWDNLADALAYREEQASHAKKAANLPSTWRDALEALGYASIVCRTVTETPWTVIEEK